MGDTVRIDKWLWAVRIFKTRSLAAEECKKGRVMINNVTVKPSREVKVGEIIFVRKAPITFQYKVLQLADKRMGAKLVPEFMENVTPESEFEVIEMQKYMQWSNRDKGTGRPTKKDRRDLDDFQGW